MNITYKGHNIDFPIPDDGDHCYIIYQSIIHTVLFSFVELMDSCTKLTHVAQDYSDCPYPITIEEILKDMDKPSMHLTITKLNKM